jgi:predicted lipid-binding transport protein (Tim44 family)
MKWIWIILAIVYLLSPFDIIPGIHPAAWLDDILVAYFLYRYLSRFFRSSQPGPFAFGNRQNTQRPSESNDSPSSDNDSRTPHDILGIPPDADQNTIRKAYRNLANQYHPDKVAHLGEEFQKLAEKRFKAIQQAYERLKHQ